MALALKKKTRSAADAAARPEPTAGPDAGPMSVADRLAETRRARAILDNMIDQMPINVMTCDPTDFRIDRVNKTSIETLRQIEHLLPIKVDEILGQSIDIFHKDPGHQRRLLADPSNLPHLALIKLGEETMALNACAIRDDNGNYVSIMVTWKLVTNEVGLTHRVNDVISSAATEMQSTAETMSTTAEETNRQATAVAAAAEEASANVQTVASAAEELSNSVGEISRQVTQSASIAQSAVEEAERTNATIQGLAEAAEKIGAVVDLINDIASQTKLLALNATIEAARAGDAGKGSEVKNLADQTEKATKQIADQVGGMQAATGEAVGAIGKIAETIGEIDQTATAIASAVEEQGAATQEIARNVQQASEGTRDVSSNIGGVSEAANQTGRVATKMLEASGNLSQQAESLRTELEEFVSRLAS